MMRNFMKKSEVVNEEIHLLSFSILGVIMFLSMVPWFLS